MPTSNWCPIAREFGELPVCGKANESASLCAISWFEIDWKVITIHVKQLQMRIAKAMRDGKHRKIQSLQWL